MNIRLLFLLVLILSGCSSDQAFEEKFFSNNQNTVAHMRPLSLEEQYELFRYGYDKMEPPAIETVDPIAERGAQAVPFLLEQLRVTPDEITTTDIVIVFESMNYLGTYKVRNHPKVLRELTASVEQIHDSRLKDFCEKKLHEMEK
jgi:hypothetical protein